MLPILAFQASPETKLMKEDGKGKVISMVNRVIEWITICLICFIADSLLGSWAIYVVLIGAFIYGHNKGIKRNGGGRHESN